MIWPFVIFGLPRSRTAWLATWLSYSGLKVGHDLGPRADTVQGFLDSLWPLAGTAETGAQDAHRLLRTAMPDAKFVVIKRPVPEVEASLVKFGLREPDLKRRSAVLDEIDALHIPYSALSDVRTCAMLWEYLYPAIPFDFAWWRAFDQQNVQINLKQQVEMLTARRPQIETLKAEVRQLAAGNPQFVRIGWEPADSWWADAEPLAVQHSLEVNAGERHGHPFKVNVSMIRDMERTGTFRVLTARINGQLVGYLTWTFTPDVESEGVLLADQGAWYVAPEARGVGRKMLDFSIEELQAAGIHSLQLHHQLNGRSARVGTLFKRMGAIEHQHRYTLWIGPAEDAPEEPLLWPEQYTAT